VKSLREQNKCEVLHDSMKVGSNSITRNHQNISIDEPIPIEPLIVLNGTLNGVPVRVLKDDGCNTNIVSQRVVDRCRASFQCTERKVTIQHSRKGSDEVSSKVVLNGKAADRQSLLHVEFRSVEFKI